ncbi:hypothetical protein [Rothia aeria]|uniref:hypothetical protein n=1 Tax=Rothia aeria TaxID=172042 RepID=UPI00244B6190|nr:hypothetical protein [Rothia aeria]
MGKYAHAAGQGGFVTSDTVGLAGFEDEGGHAVETYIFSNGFVPPRLAKNGRKKGMGLHCGRSRRRRPAEIGKGTDNIEVAVFTGDFIDDMGTPIGTRASERRNHLKFVSENLAELLDPDPIYGYYLAKNSFVALVLEFT